MGEFFAAPRRAVPELCDGIKRYLHPRCTCTRNTEGITPNTAENILESKGMYNVVLIDISSEDKLLWQTSQPSFLSCLSDMDNFLLENHITLYSKILNSTQRDNAVDKELEGFILNKLEN